VHQLLAADVVISLITVGLQNAFPVPEKLSSII